MCLGRVRSPRGAGGHPGGEALRRQQQVEPRQLEIVSQLRPVEWRFVQIEPAFLQLAGLVLGLQVEPIGAPIEQLQVREQLFRTPVERLQWL